MFFVATKRHFRDKEWKSVLRKDVEVDSTSTPRNAYSADAPLESY